MKEVEKELMSVPFSEPVLLIKQMNASRFWDEVCWRHKSLGSLTPHEKAKVEFIASGKLQTRYEELNAQVEKAIEDYNLDEADASAVSLASGDSILKKNLQKKTTEPTLEPSADKRDEKLNEEPPVDNGEEDPTALIGASKAKAGERAPGGPLDDLKALKDAVEVQIEQIMKMLESKHSLS